MEKYSVNIHLQASYLISCTAAAHQTASKLNCKCHFGLVGCCCVSSTTTPLRTHSLSMTCRLQLASCILKMSVIKQLTLKAVKQCLMFLKGSAMPLRLCLFGKILTCCWARGKTKTLPILKMFSMFHVKLYISLYAIVILMHKVYLLETIYVFFRNQVGYRAFLFYVSKEFWDPVSQSA